MATLLTPVRHAGPSMSLSDTFGWQMFGARCFLGWRLVRSFGGFLLSIVFVSSVGRGAGDRRVRLARRAARYWLLPASLRL